MKLKKTTDSVFRDLGFGREEAANLKLRAMLMVELEKYIRAQHLTQRRAAERFGVTQPRISNLVRGTIELFSVDTLIAMLSHAGVAVDIRVKQPAAQESP